VETLELRDDGDGTPRAVPDVRHGRVEMKVRVPSLLTGSRARGLKENYTRLARRRSRGLGGASLRQRDLTHNEAGNVVGPRGFERRCSEDVMLRALATVGRVLWRGLAQRQLSWGMSGV